MNTVPPSFDSRSQFYLHGNDSSLSTIQLQNPPTQVSSVGFNTLKKQSTNTSQVSLVSTSTNKTNALARLFTRNRSSSTINEVEPPQSLDVSQWLNDTELTIGAEKTKPSSNIFKMSRNLKARLRFSGKGVSIPDLSIQTSGHHTLKVPKKILSSTNAEESRKSVTSPSLHHIFHRPHAQSVDSQPSARSKENSLPQLQMNSNPNRTAIGLSSQSSNSFISDLNSAIIYNFTDPDYSGGANGALSEGALVDFHRKYMTSTDQYMLQRLYKTLADSGIGADSDQDVQFPSEDNAVRNTEFARANARAFSSLFGILRPLFQPSKQVKLSNGYLHPQLPMTIEHIANFVQEQIVNAKPGENTGWQLEDILRAHSPNKPGRKSRQNTMSTATSGTSEGVVVDDDSFDFIKRETVQNLYSFFVQCFLLLLKETTFPSHSNAEIAKLANTSPSKLIEHTNIPITKFVTAETLKSNRGDVSIEQLTKMWVGITHTWRYFNSKVRFSILNVFFPLQAYLDEEENKRVSNDLSSIKVEIESILLTAFRDTILIPYLQLRRPEPIRSLLSSMPLGISNLPKIIPSSTPLIIEEERNYLKSDPDKIYRQVMNCFGVISSHMRTETSYSESDLRSKDAIFLEVFSWLSTLK